MSADTMVERVARAILVTRIGEDGAARCEEGDSLAWKDAQRYARAAIEAIGIERLEAEKRLWLPIESAPKDATWVLTWSAKDGPGLGRYMGYTSLTDDENWSGATHWMPFPELPTLSAVGEIRPTAEPSATP